MLAETIKTDRLILRPHTFQDVDDVFAFATDLEWAKFLPVPQPYTRPDAEKFIAIQLLLDKKVHQSWAIEYNGAVIGGINIRFTFAHQFGEIGYGLARKHWGQGLMTEAVSAIIDATFAVYPDLNRIQAMADARNGASLRVMEKVGMVREGRSHQSRLIRGEFVDMVWCGMLRADFGDRSATVGQQQSARVTPL